MELDISVSSQAVDTHTFPGETHLATCPTVPKIRAPVSLSEAKDGLSEPG